MKKCDLHIHSKFSDSDAGLEDIFKLAVEKQLSCIAITDHDTIDGIAAAEVFSRGYDVELISAIELTASHAETEVHILGYFIDYKNSRLTEALSVMKSFRINRFHQMIEKLQAIGIKLDKDEVFSKVENGVPTRLHLGLYLVEKGIVSTLVKAFRKYLSPGKPAYFAQFKYSVKEAIQLIKQCGGLSFLAHPQMLPNGAWIEEFVTLGLDGIEAVYPRLSEAKTAYYIGLADKLGILKSGGSDAHGSYKKFTNIGEVSIPYQWVEEMKNRKSNIF